MSKAWQKYLDRLPKNVRIRLLTAIKKIRAVDLDALDIVKLKGRKSEYRCRVGKYRIIFRLEGGEIELLAIDARGDAY